MTSLHNQLQKDFPDFLFQESDRYSWSPQKKTVFYAGDNDEAQLLHELGHALLNHTTYQLDIHLLEMERNAWTKARELAPQYQQTISDDTIQTALDTYRDWLHARSTCPTCASTGLQVDSNHYTCLACLTTWRVNDARICGLRRYITQK